MLQFAVLAHHSLFDSAFFARNSLRIRTYKPPFPQPLYIHHLQTPPASVHSKVLTSPAESTLPRLSAPNPFIFRTYKKHGGWVPQPFFANSTAQSGTARHPMSLFRLGTRIPVRMSATISC